MVFQVVLAGRLLGAIVKVANERPHGDVGSRVLTVVAGCYCIVAAVLPLFNRADMCFEDKMT